VNWQRTCGLSQEAGLPEWTSAERQQSVPVRGKGQARPADPHPMSAAS
jgi:hypothetical protein